MLTVVALLCCCFNLYCKMPCQVGMCYTLSSKHKVAQIATCLQRACTNARGQEGGTGFPLIVNFKAIKSNSLPYIPASLCRPLRGITRDVPCNKCHIGPYLKDLLQVPLPLKKSLGLLGALWPAGQPLQLQSSCSSSKNQQRDHGGSVPLWLSLFSQMRQACRPELMLPSLAP